MARRGVRSTMTGTPVSIRDGERSVLVKCHAGCDPRDIVAALQRDQRWSDIRDPLRKKGKPKHTGEDTTVFAVDRHECRPSAGRRLSGTSAAAASRPSCRRVCGITRRSSTPTSVRFSRAWLLRCRGHTERYSVFTGRTSGPKAPARRRSPDLGKCSDSTSPVRSGWLQRALR